MGMGETPVDTKGTWKAEHSQQEVSPHLEVGQSDVRYSKNQQVTKYETGSRTWPDKN
jgi:hypothetical protein